MLDVVCMGSSTIDLFVNVNKSMKQIHPGDKTLVSNLDYETGGGGTNGAVSLARLGCKVAYLGKVGDDHNGERILKELKKENVKVIKTKLSKLRTSFSVLLETKEKDRTIFTFKGANNDLSLDDFKLKKVRAKWLYMTTHLNKSFKTCKEVARYVKKRNTKILFNPSQYLAKQKSKISPILKLTDIIVLNKVEAQLMTKSKSGTKQLAKIISSYGPKTVIITEGKKGVYYFDGVNEFKIPAKPTKVVSTAGAGDAFTSGFLAARIKGEDIKTALNIGMKNASSVLKHLGTKNKLLTWSEMR
ncbi:carbohydrate kinase family protein [Candidatus Woesearchaeota archaeon]|jgi:ribokinase|nr:carbohydrate kinase family protein [Candidatus Woesearchaeota archaeon]MBT4368047.1 carbohydrate kinase family protein [Candidatus Woesearchaeota archaeon]MBT4712535.1 carbohydrate kinase family protein [Candidatus Woesearchaeota archaeon]MBT6639448.1 carbohydrate kinase family protein [Candidatus Woesearchaeota archaeon]MBT7133620.1 carbohydrate kinase family protein [Candidatus Woesearchaeota archaeon]